MLGVGVNLFTLVVVRATSSVTVKILNTLRCIFVVIIGVVFYGETHTQRQYFGYAVALVGFLGYNYFQLFEDRAAIVERWVDERLAWAKAQPASGSGRSSGELLATGVGKS
mmetsp:Transcript_65491/g.180846  ORF Transcript_65491/g.180846 Transcript_65491/m.180846 type:complete len:111 (+) Transcript_65491:3-335(+)